MRSTTITVSADVTQREACLKPEILQRQRAASQPSRKVSSGGDGVKMSASGDTTPLEADFAALRKLRDDDASGALKEFF